jgi:hypothetical protein
MAVEEQPLRGVLIQGVDTIDIIKFMEKKKNVFLAMALTDLEAVLDPESNEFKYTRKLILDLLNNYSRSVGRSLFGDVEF